MVAEAVVVEVEVQAANVATAVAMAFHATKSNFKTLIEVYHPQEQQEILHQPWA